MKKVLVIDDEKPTLTMFRLFLSAQGYEVHVAEDGRTGLAILDAQSPDVVFTDLKMPEMDGFEVLRQVKKRSPGTEVVVITGHGDMDMVVQALNLEATDFINKPISRSALNSALNRARARLEMADRGRCRVDLQDREHLKVVRVEGTFSGSCRSDLERHCRRAKGGDPAGVVIDFDTNAAVNGSGIAALINMLSDFRRQGLQVYITGLSENYRAIFEMVGVTRFAKLHAPGRPTEPPSTPPD